MPSRKKPTAPESVSTAVAERLFAMELAGSRDNALIRSKRRQAVREARLVIGALMTPHASFPSRRQLERAWRALRELDEAIRMAERQRADGSNS